MNILMLHPHDIYSYSEPWTVRIKSIARQFQEKGHSVKLAYFPLDIRDAYKKSWENSIEVFSFDRRVGPLILIRNIIRFIKLADWSDIIHFQKCHYQVSLPALIAGFIKGRSVHYDWDDFETEIFYYSNPKQIIVGGFIDIFEKLVPRVVDTVSVSSSYLGELCLQRGVSPENIFSSPVGADLQLFSPDNKSSGVIKRKYNIHNNLVLYVGQLHGGQYAELFLKAAHIILQENRDVTFMIVGDGYRLRKLRDLAAKLNLGRFCIFTGAVVHDEIPLYLSEADVCVACFEDNDITRCKSPLKVAEYLASGKAIVASSIGEVYKMVKDVGVLTEAGNVNSLAKGINVLLKDERLREDMGKRARERAENSYNWSITAENLLRAYRRAIDLNCGKAPFLNKSVH